LVTTALRGEIVTFSTSTIGYLVQIWWFKDKSIEPIIGAGGGRHLWPSPKDPTKGIHPDRWTGRNLFEDVVAADAAYGDQIRANLGMPLAEYYRTDCRRMNWLIHSTMAGITNLDRIYYSTAAMLALK
jgi:hypothetical protein